MLIYIRLIHCVTVKGEVYKVNLQETEHTAHTACSSLLCGNPEPHDAVSAGRGPGTEPQIIV